MSQFHEFCGDSTVSDTSNSEESFRSPSLSPNNTDYGLTFTTDKRRTKRTSPSKVPVARKSRGRSLSSNVTPPQSQSVSTPKRGKSVGSSQGRRIEMGPFEDSDIRIRVRNDLRSVPSSSKASTSDAISKRNSKRKQNQPKKVQPTRVLQDILRLQHSTSEFSLHISYFKTDNLLHRVTDSAAPIQSYSQRDSG